LSIGFLFQISIISITIIAISSILTFLISYFLEKIFYNYNIPILSLPFTITTIFVYLSTIKYSALFVNIINNKIHYDIELPIFLSSFFHSLGTILFMPNNIAGIMIFLMMLYFSRIIAFMGLLGFTFGILLNSYFIGSYIEAVSNPFAFNYILVSIALGGIFLLPTLQNFLISLIAVSLTVVVTDAISVFFTYYNIPIFTLPFNIITILFVFILYSIKYKEFNYLIKETPEESLSKYINNNFRFGEFKPKINLPFLNNWKVYQGFNDIWTHKGNYKYAYDFVKEIDGKTYENDGLELTDYFAYGESIISPIEGYIVDAVNYLPDNYIGKVDRINNWGNYIIIRSNYGFYVEISHLLQYSQNFKIGDYVKLGTIIGKCGNSGYSPEPHIHIQTQLLPYIGSPTIDFIFKSYIQKNKLYLNKNPLKGEFIMSKPINENIGSHLYFILDDIFKYEIIDNSTKLMIDKMELKVLMSETSEFYFTDGENKLFFIYNQQEFYFYNYIGEKDSYLSLFYKLSPLIPFYNHEINYNDYLPSKLIKDKKKVIIEEILSIINKNYSKNEIEYNFSESSKIISKYGEIYIDKEDKGFEKLITKNITIRKINEDKK
jgi:hypothetical protein